MQVVPLDVSKPFMSLYIFSIVWINVAAGTVLNLMRARRLTVSLVPSRAETMIFLLDNASYKILTSFANQWLVREREGGLVVLL
jgi:hypothetical protein